MVPVKSPCLLGLITALLMLVGLPAQAQNENVNIAQVRTLAFSQGLSELDKQCVACHQEEHPGIVADWKNSRHSHVGVGCNDCHAVSKSQPDAQLHNEEGLQGVYITPLVSPDTCGRCHAEEQAQFNESGHFRAYRQIIPKDLMWKTCTCAT